MIERGAPTPARDGVSETTVSFESLERTHLTDRLAASLATLARHEVRIAVGTSTLAVRFSRESAARAFAERFGDMLGCESPQCVTFAVALENEAYVWSSPERARRLPRATSDDVLVFLADNGALHAYLETSADVGIHAAVVASPHHLLALVGSSTAGKTTTALAAVRNGYALYSDERCIVQNARVVPFPRAIGTRAGGRHALLGDARPPNDLDPRLRAVTVDGDVVLRPSALCGDRVGGPPRPLDAIFLIEGRERTPAIERCSPYEALPAVSRSLVCRERGVDRAARLIAILRDVATFRLRLGSPNDTMLAIERALDASA